MTTREDLTVTYNTSPRVAEVDAPSTEIIMQDLVDTLRDDEEAFTKGLAFPKLLNASGKDDLGGGVSVGITVALQDTLLAFEGRTTPAGTGTVTTGSGAPIIGTITFEDSNADFVAANVARGSMVVNFTDQSIADVVEVVNSTTLITKILVNGIGNTFDSADVYHVFNVIQVIASGGNLVAVDDLGNPISAILPTAFTQVLLSASSSATLQNIIEVTTMLPLVQDIHGQVRRAIYIDTEAVVNGDGFQQTPYDNFTDAVDDAESQGLRTLVILADATIDRQLKNFILEGIGNPILDLNGQIMTKSVLSGFELTGSYIDPIIVNRCSLNNLIMDGIFIDSWLIGNLVVASGGKVDLIHCASGVPGLNQPTISLSPGNNGDLALRAYSGGLTITDVDVGANDVTIEMVAGKVTLDATCTAGVISVRGVAQLTDNSAGSVVDTSALLPHAVWDEPSADHLVAGSTGLVLKEIKDDTTQISIDSATIIDFATTLLKFQLNRNKVDQAAKTLTIYDDDGTTPLHVFDLTDFSGTPSVTEIAERVPQ